MGRHYIVPEIEYHLCRSCESIAARPFLAMSFKAVQMFAVHLQVKQTPELDPYRCIVKSVSLLNH